MRSPFPFTSDNASSHLLPREFAVEPETVRIRNPAFLYESEVKYNERTLEITYDFVAQSDYVPPEALAKYIADRKRVYDDLGYRITHDPKATTTPSMLVIAPLPINQSNSKQLTGDLARLGVAALLMVLLTAYMMRSIRVRATFDRRWSGSSPQTDATPVTAGGSCAQSSSGCASPATGANARWVSLPGLTATGTPTAS